MMPFYLSCPGLLQYFAKFHLFTNYRFRDIMPPPQLFKRKKSLTLLRLKTRIRSANFAIPWVCKFSWLLLVISVLFWSAAIWSIIFGLICQSNKSKQIWKRTRTMIKILPRILLSQQLY